MNFTGEHKENKGLLRLLVLVGWLALWWLISMLVGQSLLVPSPLQVFRALCQLMTQPSVWAWIDRSLGTITLGWLLGICCGFFLSLLALRFPFFDLFLRPLLWMVRATPVASFIVLAFLLVGSVRLPILIAFLITMPVVFTAGMDGFATVPAEQLKTARLYGMEPSKALRYMYLPAALDSFLSGCSIGYGLAWKAGIAAEVIGLSHGTLGEQIYYAKLSLDTASLFAVTLLIICLSWAAGYLLRHLLKRMSMPLR